MPTELYCSCLLKQRRMAVIRHLGGKRAPSPAFGYDPAAIIYLESLQWSSRRERTQETDGASNRSVIMIIHQREWIMFCILSGPHETHETVLASARGKNSHLNKMIIRAWYCSKFPVGIWKAHLTISLTLNFKRKKIYFMEGWVKVIRGQEHMWMSWTRTGTKTFCFSCNDGSDVLSCIQVSSRLHLTALVIS